MQSTGSADTVVSEADRYRLLVDAVSDYAIYMLDPAGVVASWNTGAQRLKGYSAAEILGQHFSRFYTEEDRASGLPERALRTASEEGRFEQEGRRVRKDGTLMWAHVVIDPIRDPSGRLLGFAKITRDVSARKAAQDALKASEERFRILVQGVHDYAIYMLDPEGQVTNWNAGAQRFKGYSESEIVGQHFSRFYTEEDRATDLPKRALQTALTEGKFEQEGWRVRKDGTRFWASVVIDPIRAEDGTLLGFAKVTRDITERREAQAALEASRARSIQSQKMEAIGQLTGGVAHDFNNLLAVVLGNLELARKRLPPDPKLKQFIENSIQASKRGASLTQRMLAFARQQELNAARIEVPGLIHGMADLLQRSIGPNIQINTEFPLRLPAVMADANQLELAVLNLAVNARDAMPDGGTITISGREREVGTDHPSGIPAGSYICLAVADTGAGMSEDVLARAVEPFFTTKGVGKGTGLGLSMVHGFAHQTGGRLMLRSEIGKGTVAELWVPLAEPVKAADEPSPTERDAERLPGDGTRLTVLAVDDDPLVLMNTAAMLEDLGHEVIEAASGEQALRALRRANRIDVVITDQLMPGLTGTELADAIRSEWPGMAVVIATGYADLPSGTDITFVRLNKPFLQKELARALAASTQLVEAKILPFRTA